MTSTEIENIILAWAYDQWLRHSGGTVYSILNNRSDLDERQFERVAENLESDSFIAGVGRGRMCEIQPRGILEAENRGLLPEDHVRKVSKIRYEILDIGYRAFEDEGRHGFADLDDVIDRFPDDRDLVTVNYSFAVDAGLIKTRTIRRYSITEMGKQNILDWRSVSQLSDKFQEVEAMKPQPRGKAFESLIGTIFRHQGWEVDEGIRTSNEEFDLIARRGREFFLIECKWEKEPIGTIHVNHLLAKLNKRADTKGAVFSMSGFTDGAIKDVQEATAQRSMILFGAGDVAALLKDPHSLESMIDEKYTSLVTRRIAPWA